MGLKEFTTRIIKHLGNAKTRPPFEGFYIYILAATIGYSVADLSILKFRPEMLPVKAPPSRPQKLSRKTFVTQSQYRNIADRNIFNYKGDIPPALSQDEKPEKQEDGPAVLSKLPLKLLGTIVHLDPRKSIATINLSNKNTSESFRVGERIDTMAEVLKVERRKIIFRNLGNNRREYIEIPEDSKITFGLQSSAKVDLKNADEEVKQDGDQFTIKRSDLDKYTSDLSNILKQARMVPNIVPGSGGRIDGFRFVSIQPDSIFAKLGFKPGDIIKGVNNEPVTSPTQAMEMYQALKSSDRLDLNLSRNGQDKKFEYLIE